MAGTESQESLITVPINKLMAKKNKEELVEQLIEEYQTSELSPLVIAVELLLKSIEMANLNISDDNEIYNCSMVRIKFTSITVDIFLIAAKLFSR